MLLFVPTKLWVFVPRLIHDHFSAQAGSRGRSHEHHLHGRPNRGTAVAWDLVQTFLAAEFSQAERHLRRLGKVSFLGSTRAGPASKLRKLLSVNFDCSLGVDMYLPLCTFVSFVVDEVQMREPQRTQRYTKDRCAETARPRSGLLDIEKTI